MEWMLQVVDEFDDCVSAVRFKAEGLGRELGRIIGAVAVCTLAVFAAWNGGSALLLAAAMGSLGGAAILKAQNIVLPPRY